MASTKQSGESGGKRRNLTRSQFLRVVGVGVGYAALSPVIKALADNAGTGGGGTTGGGGSTFDGNYYQSHVWYDEMDADGNPVYGWDTDSRDQFYRNLVKPESITRNGVTTVINPNGQLADSAVSGGLGLSSLAAYNKAADAALARAKADASPAAERARVIGVFWVNGPVLPENGYSLISWESGTTYANMVSSASTSELPDDIYGQTAPDGTTWRQWVVAHNVVPGSGFGVIVIAIAEGTPPRGGYAYVKKVSSTPVITDGNAMYSLAGAVYTISDASGTVKATLTTKDDGTTDTVKLSNGTYYVKETQESKGYHIDKSMNGENGGKGRTLTITSSNTSASPAVVNSSESPYVDPPEFVIQKVDADGYAQDSVDAIGDGTLDGAEFTVKYYDGMYDSLGAIPTTPVRTWVTKTKTMSIEDVVSAVTSIRLAQKDPTDYLVSNPDGWYIDTDGLAKIPLGTFTVQETKAPAGYELVDDSGKIVSVAPVHIGHVIKSTVNPDKADIIWVNWTNKAIGQFDAASRAQVDASTRVGISLSKMDLNRKKPDVELRVAMAKASASDSSEIPQGDASLEGAEFTLWNRSKGSVAYDSDGDGKREFFAPDTVMAVFKTDAEGNFTTPVDALMTQATYEIRETKASTGYTVNAEWGGKFKPSDYNLKNGDILDLTDVFGECLEPVIRGGVNIKKVDAFMWGTTDRDLPDKFVETGEGNAVLAGAVFRVYNVSKLEVYSGGTWYDTLGKITLADTYADSGTACWLSDITPTVTVADDAAHVAELTTDTNGECSLPAEALPYGTYVVKEVQAPTGYLLSTDWHNGVVIAVRKDGQIIDLSALKSSGHYNSNTGDEDKEYDIDM